MNLDEFKRSISERLKGDLPGKQAHDLMMPRLKSGIPANLRHKSQPKEGAVLILIYEDHRGLRFPLIQRPTYNGVHSGQMGLPGGKAEPEDDSLYATALREAQEEIGIDPARIEIIGELSSFYVSASNYQVLPVVAVTEARPEFIPDPREVEELVIADIHHLIDEAFLKEKEILAAVGFPLRSPYFDVDGRTVWGATAMMLSEFSVILKEIYGT